MKSTLPTDPASRHRILKAMMALMRLPPDQRQTLMNNDLERRGLERLQKPVPPARRTRTGNGSN